MQHSGRPSRGVQKYGILYEAAPQPPLRANQTGSTVSRVHCDSMLVACTLVPLFFLRELSWPHLLVLRLREPRLPYPGGDQPTFHYVHRTVLWRKEVDNLIP